MDALEERLGLPRGEPPNCKACITLTNHLAALMLLKSRKDVAGRSQPARRYKGPFASELSMDSLRQSPKPWPAFFTGERGGANRAAYSLPADTIMLLDRLEENLVFFLVRTFHLWGVHRMLSDDKLPLCP